MKFVKTMLALISAAIFYFLMYRVMVAVHADDLMWFLYWIWLPFGVLLRFMEEALEKEVKK